MYSLDLNRIRICRSRRANSRASPRPPPISTGESKYKKSQEEIFWETYEPPIPKVLKNRYVLVASGVLATGLAWYSAVLTRNMHLMKWKIDCSEARKLASSWRILYSTWSAFSCSFLNFRNRLQLYQTACILYSNVIEAGKTLSGETKRTRLLCLYSCFGHQLWSAGVTHHL